MQEKEINDISQSISVSEEEYLARIKLNAAFPFNAEKSHSLMKIYGNASEAVKADTYSLFKDAAFTLDCAEKTARFFKRFSSEKELDLAERNGIRIIVREDCSYPERIAFIYGAPIVLYVRGNCDVFGRTAVAIVGTRTPTPYGTRMAGNIAEGLSKAGVVVVSGLARGIDSAAHKATLSAKGITWAVLGSGLLKTYPKENRRLADEIANSGGAVISEYPLTQSARQTSFPLRNRIISGLSNATTVIEGTFCSGSLITARCALEQGREVLALPGQADNRYSQGPHYLIKNGAWLCESAEDILSCLNKDCKKQLVPGKREEKRPEFQIESLSPENAVIYKTISEEKDGLTADELSVRCSGSTVQQMSVALFELEVAGIIFQKAGRYFAR